jgi:hypothetical protein
LYLQKYFFYFYSVNIFADQPTVPAPLLSPPPLAYAPTRASRFFLARIPLRYADDKWAHQSEPRIPQVGDMAEED